MVNTLNNYQYIKSMSLEQMTRFFLKLGNCNFCQYGYKDCTRDADACYEGILKWLKKEN